MSLVAFADIFLQMRVLQARSMMMPARYLAHAFADASLDLIPHIREFNPIHCIVIRTLHEQKTIARVEYRNWEWVREVKS